MNIMKLLYDQDVIDEMRFNEAVKYGEARGERRGIKKGKEEGAITIVINLVKRGALDKKIASKELGITMDELNKKLATVD